MWISISLFAIAAVGGAVLAVLRLRDRPLPMPLALVHGAVAAIGLVSLLLPVVAGRAGGNARIALILFVVAALGGFFLFSFHVRKKPLPIGVMAIHAIVAVIAFALLLLGALAS